MVAKSTEESGPSTGKRLVPRKEAMYRLGMGRQKWHELVRAKRIPIARVGGRVFLRSDLLDDLIDNPDKMNGSSEPVTNGRR